MKNKNITITKASGVQDIFSSEKLRASLKKSGADENTVENILFEIESILYNGISTKKIYQAAFNMLKKGSKSNAGRYNLKRAIMALGPSGFPFEKYIASIFEWQGYKVQTQLFLEGACVTHEIDVLAENDDHFLLTECKFHNSQDYICDVKIPLYIQSRFLDVQASWKQLKGHAGKFHQGWVVTNTRFSEDAIQYARCMNLNLLGWDYPINNGLKDWIDNSGLHPITALTTLTQQEKQQLLDKKIVLCKTINSNHNLLQSIGIAPPRLQKVIDECSALCEASSKTNFLN